MDIEVAIAASQSGVVAKGEEALSLLTTATSPALFRIS